MIHGDNVTMSLFSAKLSTLCNKQMLEKRKGYSVQFFSNDKDWMSSNWPKVLIFGQLLTFQITFYVSSLASLFLSFYPVNRLLPIYITPISEEFNVI